jgi:16S rRNA (adenine1518-N6/adenine1519-N6)-dimethyltransferase
MSLLEETRQILRTYSIIPNKLLGQNFIVDESVFQRLVNYAALTSNDVVLDVGAGFGFLTSFLAVKCRVVFAVEKDHSVASVLNERLSGSANVTIIKGDVLTTDLPPFDKVVSAPPYQISSALLMWLFDRHFDCAVMILQAEFAKRLVANVGTEDYSWLTVYAYSQGTVELLDDVPRSTFYPQPEVGSIVVRLTPHAKSEFNFDNLRLFVQMLKHVFSERNKKLSNAVLPFAKNVLRLSTDDARLRLRKLPFYEERVRTLKPEAFGEVAHVLID